MYVVIYIIRLKTVDLCFEQLLILFSILHSLSLAVPLCLGGLWVKGDVSERGERGRGGGVCVFVCV